MLFNTWTPTFPTKLQYITSPLNIISNIFFQSFIANSINKDSLGRLKSSDDCSEWQLRQK